jgi:hypothetical protein
MKKCIALVGISLLVSGTRVEAQRSSHSVAGVAQQEIGQGPKVTGLAGIATGDNTDFGLAIAATFTWPISDLPINFRLDPILARYGIGTGYLSGVVDGNLLVLGVGAAAQYDFKSSTGGKNTPYVMGGLGLYYRRASIGSTVTPGDFNTSTTDFGLSVGGGVRLGDKLVLEGRVMDIGGFTTIPIMIGYRP